MLGVVDISSDVALQLVSGGAYVGGYAIVSDAGQRQQLQQQQTSHAARPCMHAASIQIAGHHSSLSVWQYVQLAGLIGWSLIVVVCLVVVPCSVAGILFASVITSSLLSA